MLFGNSVDKVLKGFTTLVDDLKALENKHLDKAIKHKQRAEDSLADHNHHIDEAARANVIAANIKTLITAPASADTTAPPEPTNAS